MGNNNRIWIIAIISLLVICCLCIAAISIAGIGGLILFNSTSQSSTSTSPWAQVPTQVFEFALPTDMAGDTATETPVSPTEDTVIPVDAQAASETLQTLIDTFIPNNDPIDLARRLAGKTGIPTTMDPSLPKPSLGDVKPFWVSNVDTNEQFQVDAELVYMTPHSYFWVQTDLDYDKSDLISLADTFESKIYPTNREFFGSEWTPGVDNDERLYVLYAANLGNNLAGYFSSVDSLHPLAHEYSNGHELFVFSADNLTFDEEYTYGVLAHEFQHMIHWYHDRNEDTWLNEGFAELSVFLNNYGTGFKDYMFAQDPDIQLTDWPTDFGDTTPHYGAAFLFVTYFLDRFGEDATKALVAESDNGMDSVDKVLSDLGITDPFTNKVITADEVYMDWTTANLLGDRSVSDGRYAYTEYTNAPQVGATEYLNNCKTGSLTDTVSQYGTDYIELDCSGTVTLSIQGTSEVKLLPESAHSGLYAFWSNKGDESNMRLTKSLDLTTVSGPINLSYWMWYDLEEDYDYLYLSASEDGESWAIIETPRGTDEDISGNSYGWGYNGQTGGWVQETVDLSAYAGKTIQIRFEYVTDAAVNGEGFLLDDVTIDAIGYVNDFETTADDWTAEGFVQIQNRLPQEYGVRLIKTSRDGDVTIEDLTLDENKAAQVQLDFDNDVSSVIVSVTGLTRFTRTPARYDINLRQ